MSSQHSGTNAGCCRDHSFMDFFFMSENVLILLVLSLVEFLKAPFWDLCFFYCISWSLTFFTLMKARQSCLVWKVWYAFHFCLCCLSLGSIKPPLLSDIWNQKPVLLFSQLGCFQMWGINEYDFPFWFSGVEDGAEGKTELCSHGYTVNVLVVMLSFDFNVDTE